MVIGTIATLFRVATADRLTQFLEPHACPRELDTQNGETHRDYDNRGSWCHDHDQANQQHGRAYGRDDNAPGRFVSEVHRSLDQYLLHSS